MLKRNGLARSCCTSIWIFAVLSLAVLTVPARAATATFEIEPQDLSGALKAFAVQSHREIFFAPELARGRKSQGVKGTFDDLKALNMILEGTGLNFSVTASNAILVRNPTSKNESSREPATPTTGAPAKPSLQVAQTPSTQIQNVENTSGQESNSKEAEKSGLSEIVVTGTLLHDVAPITPVITITHDDIINQGYTTLAQVIDQLPQNFQGGGTSPSSNPANGVGGSASSNNFTYASGINLRGLGGNATLVLLNGRRLAPTALGSTVDISQIPVSAIDRVEILTDGASALYGSDAVAGVVNVITKHDFSGFEIGGRTTGISEGKTPDYGADLVGGYSWNGGGFIASADYQKDNPLFARNRSFADMLPDPWALSPQDEAEHIYLSVHQQLADRLNLSMDTLITHRDYEAQNNTFDLPAPYVASGKVDQYSVSPQLDYAISSDWTATVIGQWSKEQDTNSITVPEPYSAGDSTYPVDYQVISIEPRVDGKLFDTPGGAARVAIGAQEREEKYDFTQSSGAPGSTPIVGSFDISRHVTSVYGELMVPIIGAGNANAFTRELRVDLSGRYDHYSDFGGTTNPKLGISWTPADDLTVHGTYARSFQAPTLNDLTTLNNFTLVAPSADTSSPAGSSLALVKYDNGNPSVQPETAKSFNFGFTYAPSSVSGLKLDASFFSINFNNQIVNLQGEGLCVTGSYYCTLENEATLGSFFQRNPSLAQVESIVNSAGTVYNFAGGNYAAAPYTLSDIKALATVGLVNAASTRIRGVDLTPRYSGVDTRYGRFRADLDATYYVKYEQRLTATAPAATIDNTTYNPLRFRAKANAGWDLNGLAANVRVNFANAYTNTIDANCPSGCRVSSWTTVDAGLSYSVPKTIYPIWLGGARFAVVVTNVFDRQPPYVPTGAFINYGFDPVNASPLLRSISVTFTKRWGGEAPR